MGWHISSPLSPSPKEPFPTPGKASCLFCTIGFPLPYTQCPLLIIAIPCFLGGGGGFPPVFFQTTSKPVWKKHGESFTENWEDKCWEDKFASCPANNTLFKGGWETIPVRSWPSSKIWWEKPRINEEKVHLVFWNGDPLDVFVVHI